MKILINVTKNILKKSSACRDSVGTNCAIAVAIQEIFPYSWTSSSYITVYDGYLSKRELGEIDLPWEAKSFIKAFDNKTPKERIEMTPISFEIDVPESLIQEIGISEIYRILSESKTLQLAEQYENI